MEFNSKYTEQQQRMVEIINNEITTFNTCPTEYCCGFALESVKQVLEGKSPIEPGKVLNKVWERFFGDATAEDFFTNESYGTNYSSDDFLLAARINLRLKESDVGGNGITSADIARKMNKSPGMVSQLINCKYNASPTKHLHAVWSILNPVNAEAEHEESAAATEESEGPIVIRYGEIPFVDTSVSKLIKMSCNNAKERRRFAVFAGQAGLGKSKGIQAYAEDNQEAIVIDGSELTASTQIIEELCEKLGISRTASNPRNLKRIISALIGTDRIIILDEADKCKPNALDPLRTISDKAMIGVVLVGNIQLVEKLQSEPRYELINSRVCFWTKPAGELPVADIKTLFTSLTRNTIPLAKNNDAWWTWLHKRVEGNARLLVENLLPHLLTLAKNRPDGKIGEFEVNQIFLNILNKPSI